MESVFEIWGCKKKQIIKVFIAIVARAVHTSSERKTAQILEMNSALSELYNYHDWQNTLRIISTHTIQIVEIPTDTKTIRQLADSPSR